MSHSGIPSDKGVLKMNTTDVTQINDGEAASAGRPTEQGESSPAIGRTRRRSLSHQNLPQVFHYKDYRKFLADWLTEKKKLVRGFSGQLFARKAGIASGTLLGMVTRGHRNLSAQTIRGFARALDLTGPAARYFETLVLLNQAQTLEDQSYYLTQLTHLSPPGPLKDEFRRVSDYTDFVGAWHHPIVHELVGLKGFEANGEWISRQLSGAITPAQAEQSLSILKRLGMIELNAEGKWAPCNQKVMITPLHPDQSVQNFHRVFLEHASQVALKKPRSEREFGFVTLSGNQTDFLSICEQVRDFWKGLLAKYPLDAKSADRVITVSIQALELSQPSSLISTSLESTNLSQNTQETQNGSNPGELK